MKDALVNGILALMAAAAAWMGLPLLDASYRLPFVNGYFNDPGTLGRVAAGVFGAVLILQYMLPNKERRVRRMLKKFPGLVHKMYDMVWNVNTFCQGWLVTGITGAGKTQFLIAMIHSLMMNQAGEKTLLGKWKKRPYGSMLIDEKGDFEHIQREVMKAHGREEDLIVLKTRPPSEDDGWEPPYRCNLIGDERIPSNTYADAIVKGAKAAQEGAKGQEKPFFINMARFAIGQGIELFRCIAKAQAKAGLEPEERVYPTLSTVLEILTSRMDYDELLLRVGVYKKVDGELDTVEIHRDREVLDTPELDKALHDFEARYWSKKGEEFSGIKSTIETYLKAFANPDVAAVFCTPGDFSLDLLDEGKHICVAMPQSMAVERRYIQSFLKSLFYLKARSRFDMSKEQRKSLPLLVLFQDEAQRFIQPDDGDVDILRSSECTTILLTQDQTSFYPRLGGKENAVPILNNLRNRVIFNGASEECADASSKFIGKFTKWKASVSRNRSGTVTGTSNSEQECPLLSAAEIRSLPPFVMAVCHSKGIRRLLYFRPVEASTGKATSWWRKEASWKIKLAWLAGEDVSYIPVTKALPKDDIAA